MNERFARVIALGRRERLGRRGMRTRARRGGTRRYPAALVRHGRYPLIVCDEVGYSRLVDLLPGTAGLEP